MEIFTNSCPVFFFEYAKGLRIIAGELEITKPHDALASALVRSLKNLTQLP